MVKHSLSCQVEADDFSVYHFYVCFCIAFAVSSFLLLPIMMRAPLVGKPIPTKAIR